MQAPVHRANRDGHQPASDVLRLFQRVEAEGGGDEHVLDNVVDLAAAPHQPVHYARDVARVPAVERGERALVALSRSDDQHFVLDDGGYRALFSSAHDHAMDVPVGTASEFNKECEPREQVGRPESRKHPGTASRLYSGGASGRRTVSSMPAEQEGFNHRSHDPGAGAFALAPFDPVRSARQRLTSYAVLAAPCLVALLVSFLVTPDDIESGRVVLSAPCLTRTLLGVPCPSCGMTRAFAALSHGEVALAWHYNALAPALYAVVWAVALWASVGALQAWRGLRRLERDANG